LYNIYIFKKGELCDVFVFSRMLTMTGERESTQTHFERPR